MSAPRYQPVPLQFEQLSADVAKARQVEFHDRLLRRRTVRHYSSEPVPQALIDRAVAVAASAPSGANLQPWRFVIVRDADIKHRIREAAEQEERHFYEHRAPQEWLDALAPLGTDWQKPFLDDAPVLIVVFRIDYDIHVSADGQERQTKHYYAQESVGIACGFLLAALHLAGLATLTHTPSPMGFLASILGRPKNEKPFLLIPVGYPAVNAMVPTITKKPFDDVCLAT